MNRHILAGLVAAVLSVPSALALPTVSINVTGPGNDLGGGIFTAVTSDKGSFETFCLELNEHVVPGASYYYSESDSARFNGNNTVDPLSLPSAWLYSQFRAGAFGAMTAEKANGLQNALWYMEGEVGALSLKGQEYYDLATGPTGANANETVDANGAYGVYVMNIWSNPDGTGALQDVLGVPDHGTTLVLLGLALSGLGLVARRARN